MSAVMALLLWQYQICHPTAEQPLLVLRMQAVWGPSALAVWQTARAQLPLASVHVNIAATAAST
jgi:hypothetical protein